MLLIPTTKYIGQIDFYITSDAITGLRRNLNDILVIYVCKTR